MYSRSKVQVKVLNRVVNERQTKIRLLRDNTRMRVIIQFIRA